LQHRLYLLFHLFVNSALSPSQRPFVGSPEDDQIRSVMNLFRYYNPMPVGL